MLCQTIKAKSVFLDKNRPAHDKMYSVCARTTLTDVADAATIAGLMNDPVECLEEKFGAAMLAAFGAQCAGVDPLIGPAQNPKFGDYQSNVAMPLAKRLGRPLPDLVALAS